MTSSFMLHETDLLHNWKVWPNISTLVNANPSQHASTHLKIAVIGNHRPEFQLQYRKNPRKPYNIPHCHLQIVYARIPFTWVGGVGTSPACGAVAPTTRPSLRHFPPDLSGASPSGIIPRHPEPLVATWATWGATTINWLASFWGNE